jgi:hypothetical protein
MADAAQPDGLLAKLDPSREIAVGAVRGLARVLPELVLAGWVEVRKEARAQYARLSPAGAVQREVVLARVPPPKPPRPPRAAKPATPRPAAGAKVTTAGLAARLDALAAEVAALTARLTQLERPAAPPLDLAPTVLDAIVALDAAGRYGGLVPIPVVRAELRRRGATDDAAITDALIALERSFLIDLSVAQSPTTAPDRDQGIERPGRGLLYYVARR